MPPRTCPGQVVLSLGVDSDQLWATATNLLLCALQSALELVGDEQQQASIHAYVASMQWIQGVCASFYWTFCSAMNMLEIDKWTRLKL